MSTEAKKSARYFRELCHQSHGGSTGLQREVSLFLWTLLHFQTVLLKIQRISVLRLFPLSENNSEIWWWATWCMYPLTEERQKQNKSSAFRSLIWNQTIVGSQVTFVVHQHFSDSVIWTNLEIRRSESLPKLATSFSPNHSVKQQLMIWQQIYKNNVRGPCLV